VLYRDAAEKAGITYADVWDGFVDEAGRFLLQGPDFEGQIRRRRSYDGVYFTKAGHLVALAPAATAVGFHQLTAQAGMRRRESSAASRLQTHRSVETRCLADNQGLNVRCHHGRE
jgi:hypothetical protein